MKSALLLLINGVLLFSCTSMSTLQTARTLSKGQLRCTVGLSTTNSKVVKDSDTIKSNTIVQEVGFRLGVRNRLDVGLKVSLIGSISIDGKYQFLGTSDSKLAGSIGIGFGYSQISGDKLFGKGNPTMNMGSVVIPLYFSYHPGLFSFYASPRYTYNLALYQREDFERSYTNQWYGLSVGTRIGRPDKIGLLVEGSYFKISTGTYFSQVAVGVDFRFR
jgi:Outer membrane protein beta-barrel domain